MTTPLDPDFFPTTITKCSLLRRSFDFGLTQRLDFRRSQLKKILEFLKHEEERILDSLHADMRRHREESYLTEILLCKNEAQFFLDKLYDLAEAEKPGKGSLGYLMDRVEIRRQPRGLVLIISPWNFPFQLSIMPLIGAIAAGNCVMLKPSEQSVESAKVLKRLELYLEASVFGVTLGGAAEATELLKMDWDHVFYIGGNEVGRIVMQTAAEKLCHVTLEMGGKSPCIVDKDCNIRLAAHRVMWGKCVNAGQVCLQPDYVMVHELVREEFVKECEKAVEEFYGGDVEKSEHFARIINDRHFKVGKWEFRWSFMFGSVTFSLKIISHLSR